MTPSTHYPCAATAQYTALSLINDTTQCNRGSDMIPSYMVDTVAVSFITCFSVCCLLLIFSPRLKIVVQRRGDDKAVQASHSGDKLRLGGLGLISGILVGIIYATSQSVQSTGAILILCMLPVFISGILEDMGYLVTAKLRLLSAFISSGLCVAVSGVWVERGDLAGLDALLNMTVFGIVMTVLVATVFSHSVNLVDGLNGLCASSVLCMLIGLALLSEAAGVAVVTNLSVLIAASIAGFLVLNWPSGSLFMGDAGAYCAGFLTIWLSIILLDAAPQVSVSTVLLILFYPLADTLHSVLRRIAAKKSVISADRMHLHHKLRRGIEILWLGKGQNNVSNPVATILVLPFVFGPTISGVLYFDSAGHAWIALLVFFMAFSCVHIVIIEIIRRFRKRIPKLDARHATPT